MATADAGSIEASPAPPWWRVSLSRLMAVIAVFAVGLAAMRVASEAAALATFAGTLVALLVGTLGAIVRRCRREAWIGFALFGWAYVAIALVTPIREAVADDLPVGAMIDQVAGWLHPELPSPPEPSFGGQITVAGPNRFVKWVGPNVGGHEIPLTPAESRIWDGYQAQMAVADARSEAGRRARRIGHAISALSFACFGAAAGRALADRPMPAGATNPS